jgi:hypothetical protein
MACCHGLHSKAPPGVTLVLALRRLYVEVPPAVTAEQLVTFSKLGDLQQLTISSSNMTIQDAHLDPFLSYLTALRFLAIDGASCTGEFLKVRPKELMPPPQPGLC